MVIKTCGHIKPCIHFHPKSAPSQNNTSNFSFSFYPPAYLTHVYVVLYLSRLQQSQIIQAGKSFLGNKPLALEVGKPYKSEFAVIVFCLCRLPLLLSAERQKFEKALRIVRCLIKQRKCENKFFSNSLIFNH